MNKITWGFTGEEALLEDVISSTGEGWKPLIKELVDDLFTLGWDGSLGQVKEKFGGLRFYIGQSNNEIDKRIDKAAEDSTHTCIECGEPGKLYDKGWILPLCEKHAKLFGREV